MSIQPRRVAGVILVIFLSNLLILSPPGTPAADAQSNFDQRMVDLVNQHRSSIGLRPLHLSTTMSAGAVDWSRSMASGATTSCSGRPPNFRHDPNFGVRSPGNPSGTIATGENIAYACGPKGHPFSTRFTAAGLPGYCKTRMDFTTPEFMVCSWLDSPGHRRNIETRGFNWIGSGTYQRTQNGSTVTFATHRFANANDPAPVEPPPPPAPPVSNTCFGRTVTVNLARGHKPTTGADVIAGTNGPDVIDGLGGDDIICGWGGDDIIWGDTGADKIDAGWGDDTVYGQSGDDEIRGSYGNDTIHGNRGRDILDGQGGNDRIYGYADADTIRGGPGNDKLHGNYGNDTINGGEGNDRIYGYGDNDVLNGGPGDDIIGGNFGNDRINGGDGNDRVYGSDGADTLNGDTGHDTLEGNSGNDRITGGSGNDMLNGGLGSDSCVGNAGYDAQARCESLTSVP